METPTLSGLAKPDKVMPIFREVFKHTQMVDFLKDFKMNSQFVYNPILEDYKTLRKSNYSTVKFPNSIRITSDSFEYEFKDVKLDFINISEVGYPLT